MGAGRDSLQPAFDRLVDLAYAGAEGAAVEAKGPGVDERVTTVTFDAAQLATALGLRFEPPEWAAEYAADAAAAAEIKGR
jgi:hypothetical protein